MPLGNAVATLAIEMEEFLRMDFAKATRLGYTQTAATEGMLGSSVYGCSALLHN